MFPLLGQLCNYLDNCHAWNYNKDNYTCELESLAKDKEIEDKEATSGNQHCPNITNIH